MRSASPIALDIAVNAVIHGRAFQKLDWGNSRGSIQDGAMVVARFIGGSTIENQAIFYLLPHPGLSGFA